MNFLKLRLGMIASVGLIIAITTAGAIVLLNAVLNFSFVTTLFFVVPFFLLQWIFGPKLVEYSMNVKPAPKSQYSRLHQVVSELSQQAEIEKPKLMISQMEMPNAFAYGNLFTERKVAVTEGLVNELEEEEIEAVLGHELGHIKHRDSDVMMFLSLLPALFMMVYRLLFWSSLFGGDERRGGAPIMLIAFGSLAIYLVLNLCILWFSRLREFYADEFSATTVTDGPRKLQEGLVKINNSMAQKREEQGMKRGGRREQNSSRGEMSALGSGLKAMFISDPDVAQETKGTSDQDLVEKYRNRDLSLSKKLFQLFTTHPEVTERIKTLDRLKQN